MHSPRELNVHFNSHKIQLNWLEWTVPIYGRRRAPRQQQSQIITDQCSRPDLALHWPKMISAKNIATLHQLQITGVDRHLRLTTRHTGVRKIVPNECLRFPEYAALRLQNVYTLNLNKRPIASWSTKTNSEKKMQIFIVFLFSNCSWSLSLHRFTGSGWWV